MISNLPVAGKPVKDPQGKVVAVISLIVKKSITLILLFLAIHSSGQNKKPEDYGFRHLQTIYNGDTVDVLIKSRQGEEQKAKPLFLFCQGSLPIPLIIYDERGEYGVFPFNPDSLTRDYHIAIISKPFIPLVSEAKYLGSDFTYRDSKGNFPGKYSERNLLDYYVSRNISVIKFLQEQQWITKNRLVVAGHSEGSTIAAKLASTCPGITHLIYSGGNPMGRIMSVIGRNRATESDSDSTRYGEEEMKNWQTVIENSGDMDASHGDTFKATFEFSVPPQEYLEKLQIPVLVCYGTKDWSTPFNDYLRVAMIRMRKTNFTFKAYIGTEHNYFAVLPDGKPNFEAFNWDKVANDWYAWLKIK